MSPAAVPLAIVVAVAENGVIGRDNDLPWRLKTDLRRFRRLTLGGPMIMGRRNWDSIGRALPGRRTIVMTRDPAFRAEGAEVAHGWSDARALAAAAAADMGAGRIAVVGGAEIYRLALPETDLLHLTVVHARPQGDVLFPAWDETVFREVATETHAAGPDDEYAFTYRDLVRQHGAASH